MANLNTLSQPARFWAFVEELENKGARPAPNRSNVTAPTAQPACSRRDTRGLGRGQRAGRGGCGRRRARMDQAMADMQLSSDEDGFVPIMTPTESVTEKDVLFDATTEIGDDKTSSLDCKAAANNDWESKNMEQQVNSSQGIMARAEPANSLPKNKNKTKTEEPFVPKVDVYESADSHVVNVEVPGTNKEKLNLIWRSRRGVLVLHGRTPRKAEDVRASHKASQQERSTGKFARRIPLQFAHSSCLIEAGSIAARLSDGILRIDVPKKQGEKVFDGPIHIPIL